MIYTNSHYKAEEGSGLIPVERLEAALPDPDILLKGNHQLSRVLERQPDLYDVLELVSDHVGLASILVCTHSLNSLANAISD